MQFSLHLLGKYIDGVSNDNNGDIHNAIFNAASVQLTVLTIIII
jgi:hypothetical protein